MTTRKSSKTTPPTVAFAGSGDSSPANTAKLLADRLPEELAVVYVPDRILRSQKGLKNVVTWLEKEYGEEGEGYETVPKDELVSTLLDAESKGSDPIFVFLPGDPLDTADEKLILAAQEEGIKVWDLTEGLDTVILAEPETPAEEPETPRRGKSRGTSRSAPDEAQVEAEEHVRDALSLEVNAREALGQLGETIYEMIVARLVEEGLIKGPKPAIYPCWVDDDGNYRPRLGKGRGKKGEKTADLAEEDMLSIDGLAELFEAATD